MYEKPKANTIANCESLKAFVLRSETRAGCLLLPLFFKIVLEVLASTLWCEDSYFELLLRHFTACQPCSHSEPVHLDEDLSLGIQCKFLFCFSVELTKSLSILCTCHPVLWLLGWGTALPFVHCTLHFWDLKVINLWINFLCVAALKLDLQSKWPWGFHFPKVGAQMLRELPAAPCGWLGHLIHSRDLHILYLLHQLPEVPNTNTSARKGNKRHPNWKGRRGIISVQR